MKNNMLQSVHYSEVPLYINNLTVMDNDGIKIKGRYLTHNRHGLIKKSRGR